MGPIQNPFSFPMWIPHGYPMWGLYRTYIHMLSGGFQAGQIKTKLNNWKRMTSDPEVLETVKGLKIKFAANPTTCSQKEQRYFLEN